jgi:putative sterol carrier protein
MFGKNTWLEDTVAAANDDGAFNTAAEHFDGSVALEIGDRTAWLKIYRGEIIDTESFVPQFGPTFRLVGDATAWQRLAAGDISFSEALYETSIRSRGNKLEANRLRDAIELFVRHLQGCTPDDTAAMAGAE